MANPESIVPTDIAKIVGRFASWTFPSKRRENIRELQRLAVSRLKNGACCAMVGKTFTRLVVVYEGDARKTGDKTDEGVLLVLELGRHALAKLDTWTAAAITLSNSIDFANLIQLTGTEAGNRTVKVSNLLRDNEGSLWLQDIEDGTYSGLMQTGEAVGTGRRREVLNQALRILRCCEINTDATDRYAMMRNRAGLPETVEPIDDGMANFISPRRSVASQDE